MLALGQSTKRGDVHPKCFVNCHYGTNDGCMKGSASFLPFILYGGSIAGPLPLLINDPPCFFNLVRPMLLQWSMSFLCYHHLPQIFHSTICYALPISIIIRMSKRLLMRNTLRKPFLLLNVDSTIQ